MYTTQAKVRHAHGHHFNWPRQFSFPGHLPTFQPQNSKLSLPHADPRNMIFSYQFMMTFIFSFNSEETWIGLN